MFLVMITSLSLAKTQNPNLPIVFSFRKMRSTTIGEIIMSQWYTKQDYIVPYRVGLREAQLSFCLFSFASFSSKKGTKNNENGALGKIINNNNNLLQRWFLHGGINSLLWYGQSISWTYRDEILRIPTLVWKQSILIVSAVLIQRYRKETYARLQFIPQI